MSVQIAFCCLRWLPLPDCAATTWSRSHCLGGATATSHICRWWCRSRLKHKTYNYVTTDALKKNQKNFSMAMVTQMPRFLVSIYCDHLSLSNMSDCLTTCRRALSYASRYIWNKAFNKHWFSVRFQEWEGFHLNSVQCHQILTFFFFLSIGLTKLISLSNVWSGWTYFLSLT